MKLSFVRGGALRKVLIKDRKISIMTGELGFEPFTIDLDKIEELENNKAYEHLTDEDKEMIREIAKLGSNKDITKDIIKDFQKTGWRLFKKL